MKISVVIPSRNRIENLRQVVEALSLQTLSKDEFEVIVSDDNSNDLTSTIVEEFRELLRLKYIFSNIPKPHSWCASVIRNLGALCAHPSTTHLLFVDSDVILPLNALTDYLEDITNDPNRVIIGPYDFTTKNGDKVQYAEGIEGDMRSRKFKETTINETFNTIHDGLSCFGGNLVIPKNIFWDVQGFDEDVFIGLEDGSMGIKLWKKKVNFSYESRTWGKHQWHESPIDRFPVDMAQHINKLNQKHFHMNTNEVDEKMDLISATRETYATWGFDNWNPPKEWQANQINFLLKINTEGEKI